MRCSGYGSKRKSESVPKIEPMRISLDALANELVGDSLRASYLDLVFFFKMTHGLVHVNPSYYL